MTFPSVDLVDLSVPATPRFLRLLRTTAAGVATDFGACEQATVELRLAVDEACAVLIEDADPDTRLTLECCVENRDLVVTVTSSPSTGSSLRPHPVAEAILAWSVDDYEVERDAQGRDVIRLFKPLRS